MKRARLSILAVALIALASAAASADPLRLRGDALALARPPAGLLVLQASGNLRPWLSAEAVIWTGIDDGDSDGDALVVAVRMRDPKHRGELRLGRMVVTTGALRPIHLDGAAGLARLPWNSTAEAFAGTPVRPAFAYGKLDWLVGARVAKRKTGLGSVGLAYMHQRDRGRLSDEEIAVDASATPAAWLDIAAGTALDLVELGVSEAQLSAAARRRGWRYELFAGHRSPSRLLPASSLFSVLGDIPSQRAGAAILWRAAPRLDLRATTTLRHYDGDFGGELSLRSTLRLDARGKSALGLELRRQDAPETGWSGVRGTAGLGLGPRLRAAAELELVIPDQADARGSLWPWGLVALTWQRGPWNAAAAVEASSSPKYDYELTGLLRLSRQWGMP